MSGPVYLLSSLPHLSIADGNAGDTADTERAGADIPSVEEFLEQCEYTLSPADAASVRSAMKNPEECVAPMVAGASQYLYALLDGIARKRHEERRSGAYTPMLMNDSVPVSADAGDIIARAASAKNPLAREVEVTRALWVFLDDCDADYQMSVENVIVYGYKLKLFHKIAGFQRKAGNDMWQTLVGQLAEKAGFSRDAISGVAGQKSDMSRA